MSRILPLQSNLTELRALDQSLWKAFKHAEKKDLPPAFEPFSVTATFYRLWKLKRLRPYEFYPAYGLLAVAAGIYGVWGPKWMLAIYLVMLLPTFIFLRRYVKQFAFEKTKQLGLAEYAFGVPNLPLLVNGTLLRFEEEVKKLHAAVPARPTKERLASILKLAKSGHEHGDVGYGFDDAARRWVYTGVAFAATSAVTRANEASNVMDGVWKLAMSNGRMSIGLAAMATIALLLLYSLMISPTNEKRRKRRYLLVLTALHESWPADDVVDEVEHQAAKAAIETAKADWQTAHCVVGLPTARRPADEPAEREPNVSRQPAL